MPRSADDAETVGLYFSRAAAQGELSPEGFLAWGDADWIADSPDTALQIWGIADQLGVDPSQIFSRQAEVYRVIGDDVSLIETLKAILASPLAVDLEPDDRVALYSELGLLLAANEPASASAYLSQAMELDPH